MSKTMKTQGIGRPGILAVRATREVQGTNRWFQPAHQEEGETQV